jgi:uncharacterized protein YutE (UPF0331/DUF86 family)
LEPPYDVDEANARIREVYARYGLAMYAAQLLETGLIQFVVTLRADAGSLNTQSDYDDEWDKLAKKTFGQLLKTIDPNLLDTQLSQELDNALALRNRLAHKYFWEKAADMLGEKSKEQMVVELQGYADYFKELDAQVTEKVYAWADRRGIDLEALNEIEMEKLRAKHENS